MRGVGRADQFSEAGAEAGGVFCGGSAKTNVS